LFIFLILYYSAYSGEERPFWDMTNAEILFQFPLEKKINLCRVNSALRPKFIPEKSECIPIGEKLLSESFKYFLNNDLQSDEVSFSFYSDSGEILFPEIVLGGIVYKLHKILFSKSQNNYFLELNGEKGKYFIFTADPGKLSVASD
ncbi:MAG: hypothetical protein K8R21_05970, partial [Leptospira sp.]|nr:hypothetical protein [Leptospira sp.]